MVDDLQLETLLAHVFLRQRQISRIHHEGDFGTFLRRQPLQV